MKTLVYLFAILVGSFTFIACADDPVDDVKPQIHVPETQTTDGEIGEENEDE